ncbi:hypothetical protein [Aurantiacibacter sp. D1-12]|uniref:hypothetical protein n=1 Tax=Aurantiacibacter sp. D1-12 TaxID=2993658 RepID=UPI00237C8195|nr:hypothetical protein [Aurantiacibacter sp. D1-12]MDE1466172.1 hypothetical protein [Aurantiacibacter sp. D1-12]
MTAPVDATTAAQWLLFSGALAIFWSSLLGMFMMIPHLRIKPLTKATRGINFRQLLSAHLDWIMLAFMQGLAAALLVLFDLAIPLWLLVALIYGGWMNAVPYFLRAFGINAFVYGGEIIQKTAYVLGGISVFVLTIAWGVLAWKAGSVLLG